MLKKVKINNFRGFKNIDIEFGDKVTAICGRNGTSKTTILGMIAQSFEFKEGYKTILGQKFQSDFAENFKFSKNYEKFETAGSHSYEILFDDYETKTTSKKRIDRTPKKKAIEKLKKEYLNIEKILNMLKTKNIDTSKIKESFDKYEDEIKKLPSEASNKVKADEVNKQFKDFFKLNPEIEELIKIKNEIDSATNTIKKIESEEWNLRLVTYKGKKTEKIEFPLIYLGLDRVFPLGAISNESIEMNIKNLGESYLEKYNNIMKTIFIKSEEFVKINAINSKIKTNNIGETETYDSFAVSVGQDNLSKIIWAILSFENLKDKQKENYKGGILLIDEIEASLHPSAQKNLMNYLYKIAKTLELQIIVTTHSTTIVDCVIKRKKESKIIGLINENGDIAKMDDQNPERIVNDLKLEAFVAKKENEVKINVYTEDKEAREILKILLEEKCNLRSRLNIIDRDFSKNDLKKIVKYQFKELENTFFLFDGDVRKEKFSDVTLKHIGFLPGNEAIEKELYLFLENLDSKNKFWTETEDNERYYTKDIYKNEAEKYSGAQKTEDYKKWFESEKKYFGKNGFIYRIWLEEKNEIFKKDILDIFDKLQKLIEKKCEIK